jgi:hypothetical protein
VEHPHERPDEGRLARAQRTPERDDVPRAQLGGEAAREAVEVAGAVEDDVVFSQNGVRCVCV